MEESNDEKFINTPKAAKLVGAAVNTLLWHHSTYGNYYGVVPIKRADRRLDWPVNELLRLRNGDKGLEGASSN